MSIALLYKMSTLTFMSSAKLYKMSKSIFMSSAKLHKMSLLTIMSIVAYRLLLCLMDEKYFMDGIYEMSGILFLHAVYQDYCMVS